MEGRWEKQLGDGNFVLLVPRGGGEPQWASDLLTWTLHAEDGQPDNYFCGNQSTGQVLWRRNVYDSDSVAKVEIGRSSYRAK